MRNQHKKKRHIFRNSVLILLVLLIAGGGFAYANYRNSLKEARSDQNLPDKSDITFNGEKAEDLNDVNILFIGSDSRGDDQGRSDSLMIAHYDSKSKQPKLISLMRDMYVDIPGYDKDKINAAYSYGGPELLRKTISENFGIGIEYFVIVDFDSFPKIIDTLLPDGVQIDAEKDMSEYIEASIKKGPQKMDGETLLQYARFRHDAESDFGRVRRQQQVLNAVAEQGVKVTNLTKLPSVLGKIEGYSVTNLPSSLLLSAGTDFVLGKTKPIETLTLPVEGSWENGYYEHAGSVLEINTAKNKTELNKFLED
ncbi:transcriptional regulator [Carnobacterium divergens]|uniref:LCP family protein n=1 Tax=Carnobacterium divergens TaxID=2748 RepID=UPI001071C0ED|nr:LCP family protein [Carnobacterium divergens]TFJ42933.1 transcriptional regulator [Carnobacterium divergens]TFJ50086.1 transcriptional regulator [Carnobacterium divergens]